VAGSSWRLASRAAGLMVPPAARDRWSFVHGARRPRELQVALSSSRASLVAGAASWRCRGWQLKPKMCTWEEQFAARAAAQTVFLQAVAEQFQFGRSFAHGAEVEVFSVVRRHAPVPKERPAVVFAGNVAGGFQPAFGELPGCVAGSAATRCQV